MPELDAKQIADEISAWNMPPQAAVDQYGFGLDIDQIAEVSEPIAHRQVMMMAAERLGGGDIQGLLIASLQTTHLLGFFLGVEYARRQAEQEQA